VQAGVGGSVILILVTSGHLAAVPGVDVVRNTTQTSVVVLEVLLGVVVIADPIHTVHSIAVLEGWYVARRVGLGQLRHRVVGAGKAGTLGLWTEGKLHRATVVVHVLARRDVNILLLGRLVLLELDLGDFANSVSRQGLLSLMMPISMPAIELGLRTRRLGEGQVKCSGRGREFRTITRSIPANQDGELIIGVAHLEVGLVVWRSSRVMLLVILTEEIAGGVDVAKNGSQVRQIVATTHVEAGDGHRHAVVPLNVSLRHCCLRLWIGAKKKYDGERQRFEVQETCGL
jgi:hypothetical protein